MTIRVTFLIALVGALAALSAADTARAALNFSPPTINLNPSGPTTFVVRFFEDDPANTFVTNEAFFCTAIDIGAPGNCALGSVLGRLSPSLDRGSTSTRVRAITDVVTVPYSVIRRARVRGIGSFLYVRSFTVFGPGDVTSLFVLGVTLRLTGGPATSPLSLTRVDIFGEEPEQRRVRFIRLDRDNLETGSVKADISYTGVGLLTGWWEVRTPADPPVRELDRFPAASLSQAERVQQRTFRRVQRLRIQLPATGRVTLDGPRYAELPADVPGVYEVLLRIDAVRDPQAKETLAVPGEPAELYFGASAGFALPTLEYRVGTRLGLIEEREIAGRVVADRSGDAPRLGVAWTPITGRPYVVEVSVTDPATGEVRSLVAPAQTGVVFLPDAWVRGRDPAGLAVMVTVLGPDGEPVAGFEPTALSAPAP